MEGRKACRARHRQGPDCPADARRGHRGRGAHQAGADHPAGPTAARHPDLVKRDFTATGPNQLWVTDLTYVPTFAGIAYVCFIIDAFSRMIVGWRVASHMRTEMVLDALEMARWSRGTQLTGLRCHSDAGSQFTSVRYGERLAEIGAVPSIGTVGDSMTTRSPRPSTATTRPSSSADRPAGTVAHRRRRRTRHPRLGALAQHQPAPRLPRRPTADRVRRQVLRYPAGRQALVEIK